MSTGFQTTHMQQNDGGRTKLRERKKYIRISTRLCFAYKKCCIVHSGESQ